MESETWLKIRNKGWSFEIAGEKSGELRVEKSI